jgi:hypothetical protein
VEKCRIWQTPAVLPNNTVMLTTVFPNSSTTARLRRIRWLARLLDNAIPIPGTSVRFGLDAFIGLVPVAGDLVCLVLSSYIVVEAWRLGASKVALGQMAANILIDAAVGAIPLLGDVFDVVWQANLRNVQILERDLGLVAR